MAHRLNIAFIALGCVKNLVDSEKMLGQLAEHGCLVGADVDEADVIVVNTCGFLAAARAEAHEHIRQAVAQKRRGRCRRVVVAGCLAQRDKEALLKAIPGIDALVGVNEREKLIEAVRGSGTPAGRKGAPRGKRGRRERPDLFLGAEHPRHWTDTARLRLTPRHTAYLRISEGCNQQCTFCTIPAIRGPMYSKPVEVILEEARELNAVGTVDLNLIGQDTTSYGFDLDGAPGLAGLLRELNALDGVRWIRLMYAYPTGLTDEMIEALAECARVVKYVDLPLQHISDRVLKAMRRRITRRQTEELLAKLRARIPGVAIRTTLITGFPGESAEEFEDLLRFVRDFGFDALGAFVFSAEPDTAAARMSNLLPEEVGAQRRDVLMQVQQEVVLARGRERMGTTFEALIESESPDEEGAYRARAAFQAPEVDGLTFITADELLVAGRILPVRCTGAEGYDLRARPTSGMLPPAET